MRRRVALGVARTLVARAYTGSRTHLALRKKVGTIEIKSSIFCGVRDRVPNPLCQFHAAAIARVLTELGIPAQTTIVACQATGDGVVPRRNRHVGSLRGTGMRWARVLLAVLAMATDRRRRRGGAAGGHRAAC